MNLGAKNLKGEEEGILKSYWGHQSGAQGAFRQAQRKGTQLDGRVEGRDDPRRVDPDNQCPRSVL